MINRLAVVTVEITTKKGPPGGGWRVHRADAAFRDVVSVLTTGYNGGSGSDPAPVSDGEKRSA
ncbi:hypothetical protein [Klebsiella quasipneumoniae]|uniref:hypothetical protein n=1 Tax=Klebsiella quasipneumoniae TaxID=1463165 RepID=UPI0014958F0A|nr:hypothetical protein [Klebsiella quasipneumoniae]